MRMNILIGLLLLAVVLLSGCAEKECKTAADCLEKTCFTVACRDNACSYSMVADCCGNERCDQSEAYETCAADCPNCDDRNECTVDEYDYNRQECVNAPILDRVCCGNGRCETEENYESCSRDCPNCDDNKDCTKDRYDYHAQECVNEVIIPCCGNVICDEGAETHAECEADCPDCNDGNKLTTDSFSYADQACENPLTHYIFDDMEGGIGGWVLSGEASKPTVTVENGNGILRMGNSSEMKLKQSFDDYALAFKVKRVSGSMHVYFRNGPGEGYYLSLGDEAATKTALRKRAKGEVAVLESAELDQPEEWLAIEIRAYGNLLNVYADGQLLIAYRDADSPVTAGETGFEAIPNSEFFLDDIEFKIVSEKDVTAP